MANGFKAGFDFEPHRLQPLGKIELAAELVLLAIGFEGPVRDRLLTELGVEFDGRGAIARDEHFRTSVPGVFAAGDATRGASLIVWAIAEGRKAAHAIDLALTGAVLTSTTG